MVQRTLMLAAQVFTARDLILSDTPEDYRVAYLLLDSAAEMLMVRRLETELELYYSAGERTWLGTEVPIDLNDTGQRAREKAKSDSKYGFVNWVLSSTQRRSIERDFLAKVRYIAWAGYISPELVPVLGRLHDYRNEIYHNDAVRLTTLSATVRLYALAVGALLRKLRPGSVGVYGDETERIKSIFRRAKRPVPEGWLDDPRILFNASRGLFDIQEMFAEELEASVGSDLDSVIVDLGNDVERRLERLQRQLTFALREAAQFGPHRFELGDDELTPLDIIRYAYWNPSEGATVQDLRRAPLRYNRSHFATWSTVPQRLRAEKDPTRAFAILVEFESEFEELENRISELAGDIDGEINMEIDRLRGK